MKTLPTITAISPPVETDDQQTAFYNWLGATRQLPGGGPPQAKTIASGTLTPDEDACFWILADTEGAASTDDLDRIAPTNVPNGSILILQAANTARTVVARHAQGGSGQFLNSNAANFSLDDTEKFIMYRYSSSSTSFIELTRGWGADVAALRAYLALGTAALVNTGTGSTDVPTNAQIFETPRTYTRQQNFPRIDLTGGSTVNWDLNVAQIARIIFTASGWNIAAPTNIVAGGQYQLYLVQDTTGGRTYTFDAAFKWPNGITPTFNTSANLLTLCTFAGGGSGQMYGTVSGPFNP